GGPILLWRGPLCKSGWGLDADRHIYSLILHALMGGKRQNFALIYSTRPSCALWLPPPLAAYRLPRQTRRPPRHVATASQSKKWPVNPPVQRARRAPALGISDVVAQVILAEIGDQQQPVSDGKPLRS